VAIKISFADLTHTGQVVAANTFPLGSGMVVAYAKQELGDELDIEIFKYPDDLANYLDKGLPQIACFTSFSWNIRLHNEYAKRIKALSPNTITIFGGCNFPDAPDEQAEYLAKYDSIDFYIEYEGELAFVELIKKLKAFDFDAARFKRERTRSPNVRYLVDGEFIAAPLGPKIRDLSVIPSPHLSGVLDKFYDDILIPMMQTTRGCPYQCTFCWEGGSFFTKIGRFSQDRVHSELRYIAQRTNTVPDLCIVDANFGMFVEDLDTSRTLLDVQKNHKNGWPKSVLTATAKNHKERTIEIVEMLGATLPPTAAVQSTDATVLKGIKRKNPPTAVLEAMGRVVDKFGGQSEAELILCLPGDNKTAHFRTVADMLDANMTFIRMYQFMMLPGTAAASRKSRADNEMNVRFRVLPRCFGNYRFRDEKFSVAEIEEICVSNKTMSYEDYQACRNLHLTVEIFNNDSIFSDLFFFLARYGIKRSQFIQRAYDLILSGGGHIANLYADFRAEERRNLWEKLSEVEEFTRRPGIVDKYIAGEHGTNELYKYRALAVFDGIAPLSDVAFEAARTLLADSDELTDRVDHYLTELYQFGLLRKRDPLNTKRPGQGRFHYDFVAMLQERFMCDPFEYERPEGVELIVDHSPLQCDLVNGYVQQYGTTLIGLGRILIRANMGRLYRSAKIVDSLGTVLATSSIPQRETLGRFGAIGATLPRPN
jgi:radical SAM superfamily enzyme YgiQ (UPF0313 family)